MGILSILSNEESPFFWTRYLKMEKNRRLMNSLSGIFCVLKSLPTWMEGTYLKTYLQNRQNSKIIIAWADRINEDGLSFQKSRSSTPFRVTCNDNDVFHIHNDFHCARGIKTQIQMKQTLLKLEGFAWISYMFQNIIINGRFCFKAFCELPNNETDVHLSSGIIFHNNSYLSTWAPVVIIVKDTTIHLT